MMDVSKLQCLVLTVGYHSLHQRVNTFILQFDGLYNHQYIQETFIHIHRAFKNYNNLFRLPGNLLLTPV